jgi:hypothetical protein
MEITTMAFQMGVDTAGFKVVPAGLFDIRLKGFKPKLNKNKDGVNFNAQMEIMNSPEHDGVKLFDTLSTKAGFMQIEFCHAFGMEMEDLGNGLFVLPGIWDGDPSTFKEEDPSTWRYVGPLLNRDAKVEVAIDTYEGKENNKIQRYFCAVKDCTYKHQDNLLRKK